MAFMVRLLGGIVLAHFGDLFGRKRIFIFSILLMAAATLRVATLAFGLGLYLTGRDRRIETEVGIEELTERQAVPARG